MPPRELDLVFIVDCTGSMGPYITQVQENLNKIVSQISSSGSVDSLRIAVIKYRDHPPQDSTFVTQVVDFTSDLTAIRAAIGSMSPEGGGDGPEAVTAAFKDALALSYRDDAPKIIIFIADAPPHAIGEAGDGFPDKDPAGCDLLELIQSFEAKKLIVHAVGCEPAISQYQYARDLFKAIAERTGGRYVTLANVAILSTIITGVALEEVSLAQVQDSVNQAVQEEATAAGRTLEAILGDEAAMNRVQSRLAAAGVTSHQLQVDSVHEANSDASRVRLFLESPSMAVARSSLPPTPAGSLSLHLAMPSACCSAMPPMPPPPPSLMRMVSPCPALSSRAPAASPMARLISPPLAAGAAAPPSPPPMAASEMIAADMSSCSLAAAAPSFMLADSLAMPQAQTASISRAPISLEQIRRMSARSTPRSSAPPQKESS